MSWYFLVFLLHRHSVKCQSGNAISGSVKFWCKQQWASRTGGHGRWNPRHRCPHRNLMWIFLQCRHLKSVMLFLWKKWFLHCGETCSFEGTITNCICIVKPEESGTFSRYVRYPSYWFLLCSQSVIGWKTYHHRWASTSILMSAISDIDICYSDIGDKYVGLKTVIPISEVFRYQHQSPFRYPTFTKNLFPPAGFEPATLTLEGEH